MIDKTSYLKDFIAALIAYSFGPIQLDVFWMNMEKFIIQNFEHLDPMSIENLIFVFTRISRGSKQFWE